MNKTQLKKYFAKGGGIMIVHPESHKFYNIKRQPDKVQTQSVRFEGGSWLYYKDISADKISGNGFMIDNLMGGFIKYVFTDANLVKEVENGE